MAGKKSLPAPSTGNNQELYLESIAQSAAATSAWTHNLAELTDVHKKRTDAVASAIVESQEGKPSLRSIDRLIREGNTFDKKRAKQEDKEINRPKGFLGRLAQEAATGFSFAVDKATEKVSQINKAITHDTASGAEQVKKGWNELFNGLGELGPMVSMLKTTFHKIRGVVDIMVGSIRFVFDKLGSVVGGIWSGIKGVGNFTKRMFGWSNGEGVNGIDDDEEVSDKPEDSSAPGEALKEGEIYSDGRPVGPTNPLSVDVVDREELNRYEAALKKMEENREEEDIGDDKTQEEQTKELKKLNSKKKFSILGLLNGINLRMIAIGAAIALIAWLIYRWWSNPDDRSGFEFQSSVGGTTSGMGRYFKNVEDIRLRANQGLDASGKPLAKIEWDSGRYGAQNKPSNWDTLTRDQQRAAAEIAEELYQDELKTKNIKNTIKKTFSPKNIGRSLNVLSYGLVGQELWDDHWARMNDWQKIEYMYEHQIPFHRHDKRGFRIGEPHPMTEEEFAYLEAEKAAIRDGDWAGIGAGWGVAGAYMGRQMVKRWASPKALATKTTPWTAAASTGWNVLGTIKDAGVATLYGIGADTLADTIVHSASYGMRVNADTMPQWMKDADFSNLSAQQGNLITDMVRGVVQWGDFLGFDASTNVPIVGSSNRPMYDNIHASMWENIIQPHLEAQGLLDAWNELSIEDRNELYPELINSVIEANSPSEGGKIIEVFNNDVFQDSEAQQSQMELATP